jgi:hypothetical protein
VTLEKTPEFKKLEELLKDNKHAQDYKRALLELQKQGYRIIRNNYLEPSLAKILI